MELNLFDLGVILTIGLSALLSFFRGFVREILSLGGWLIAVIVTLRFIEPASAWIKPQVKSEMIASGIAAVGLFFITLILISIIANFIVKVLKPGDKAGLLDNLAGLAFGAARGALIVGIAFSIFTIVVTEKKSYPDIVKKAYTRPYVEKAAHWISALMPEYLGKLGKQDKDDKNGLSSAAKDGAREMMKKIDHARDEADKKMDKAQDEVEDKADSLPSMEDLQRRIKEENERH